MSDCLYNSTLIDTISSNVNTANANMQVLSNELLTHDNNLATRANGIIASLDDFKTGVSDSFAAQNEVLSSHRTILSNIQTDVMFIRSVLENFSVGDIQQIGNNVAEIKAMETVNQTKVLGIEDTLNHIKLTTDDTKTKVYEMRDEMSTDFNTTFNAFERVEDSLARVEDTTEEILQKNYDLLDWTLSITVTIGQIKVKVEAILLKIIIIINALELCDGNPEEGQNVENGVVNVYSQMIQDMLDCMGLQQDLHYMMTEGFPFLKNDGIREQISIGDNGPEWNKLLKFNDYQGQPYYLTESIDLLTADFDKRIYGRKP